MLRPSHPSSGPGPTPSPVPAAGPICRHRVAGKPCAITLKPGWLQGYLQHTVKPASPHYPRPASVRELVESHRPEGQDPETWRAFWGAEP